MPARSVQQITQELGTIYDPQIKSIQSQKALVGLGVDADIQQANAAKDTAFGDILSGARRRGMGFSGIPLSEQAQYASNTYAPEVLRARQRGKQQELSLVDALNSIYERRNNQVLALQQQDVSNDQWERNFAEAKRMNDANLEAARVARSSGGGGYGGGYVGAGVGTSSARANTGAATKVKPADQQLFNQMFVKGDGGQWDDKSLVNDYNATLKSARYGNARDKQKVLFYHSFRPDLFGANVPASAMSNGNRLSF